MKQPDGWSKQLLLNEIHYDKKLNKRINDEKSELRKNQTNHLK